MVSNDQVVRFENRCLQLKPKRNQGVGAGARVTVQQGRDESLQVRFEGHEIEHEVIATPTPSEAGTSTPGGDWGTMPGRMESVWRQPCRTVDGFPPFPGKCDVVRHFPRGVTYNQGFR